MILLPEDRHKPANARCPHPERWHSADADSTEVARRMIEDEFVSTGIMRCVDLPTPRGVSICQVLEGGK